MERGGDEKTWGETFTALTYTRGESPEGTWRQVEGVKLDQDSTRGSLLKTGTGNT